jgi:hypothetical protein
MSVTTLKKAFSTLEASRALVSIKEIPRERKWDKGYHIAARI